ncbi:MAG: GNAT family N-acetyltransferase [Pseudomonadota bacterium]
MRYRSSVRSGYRYRLRIDDAERPFGLSSKTRSSLRRKRRKIEALQRFEVRWSIDEETSMQNFRTLVNLHSQRWNTVGKPGAFATQQFTDFHRDLVLELLSRDRLILFSLWIGGSPIAAHYCLCEADTAFFYQSGVDIQQFSDLSPGNVCHLLAIEESSRRGLRYYDFMAGGENSYKNRFTRPDEEALVTTTYFRSFAARHLLPVRERLPF